MELKNGEIRINLYDLFENMTDEQMEEVAQTYGWHSKQWKDIVKSLRQDHFSPNFNPDLLALFKSLFYAPQENYWREFVGDVVIQRMSEAMRLILEENLELNKKVRNQDRTWDILYREIKRLHGEEAARDLNYLWVKNYHQDEYDTAYFSHYPGDFDLVKNKDYKDFIKEWTRRILSYYKIEEINNDE